MASKRKLKSRFTVRHLDKAFIQGVEAGQMDLVEHVRWVHKQKPFATADALLMFILAAYTDKP